MDQTDQDKEQKNRAISARGESSRERKWMSVREMGNLLGLKRTDRYWLVHKQFFETETQYGKMRVNIASFENWYANQAKYKKVNGEEPGKKLKERSYSVRDISGMLGLSEAHTYELIKNSGMETVIVDYRMRVPRDIFEQWYAGQSRYRTQQDREKDAELEESSLTMPEMAKLLGIRRDQVYGLLKKKEYSQFFDFVVVAGRKRITKESFQKFLEGQEQYSSVPGSGPVRKEIAGQGPVKEEAVAAETPPGRYETDMDPDAVMKEHDTCVYYSQEEAARYAGVSRPTILYWIRQGFFPARKAGRICRIPAGEFEEWLKNRNENGGM